MKAELIRWIVINQHPFTIVKESNFINFVHLLCPAAIIPSSDTIKNYIMNFYKINKEKIQSFLQNLSGKISFTTDIWIPPSAKSFLSLTTHFINKKWELQNVIIDFIQIHNSHTGENIKNVFVSCLDNLSIQNKVYLLFNYYFIIVNGYYN